MILILKLFKVSQKKLKEEKDLLDKRLKVTNDEVVLLKEYKQKYDNLNLEKIKHTVNF